MHKAICSLMVGAGALWIGGCGSGHSIAPALPPKTVDSKPASFVRCFQRFAIGANQTPSRWTIISTKRTGPATAMRIQITFHRPGSE
jgi:hypothetical protein